MMASSSKLTRVGLLGATIAAAILATACGGGATETPHARVPASTRTTITSAQVAPHKTVAPREKAPFAQAGQRLTPEERNARRAEERAQLVLLKASCDAESGNPYARAERAKTREANEAEGDTLERACNAAALALASFAEREQAQAAEERAAERDAAEAEQAAKEAKDRGTK